MQSTAKSAWPLWLAFAALSVIWGLPYLFIKLAVAEIPPVTVAFGRLALGAAILLPVAWKRGSLRSAIAHWRPVCAFALIELAVPFPLISLGERWISSSLTAILIATVPFTVLLLSPLFGLRRQLTGRRVVGLVCGFTGVVVLLGIDPVDGALGWLGGVACVVIAVVGYAIGALIVERHLHGVDEFGSVALSLAVASLVLLPGIFLTVPESAPSMLAINSVIVLGVVCTAAALWLYFYLVARVGAARATVFTYVNPAVATLLGVVVLHERFGFSLIAGLALILTGSWLAAQRA
jgi:drug/metabolite transporter (DMT)-like permease